MTKGVGDVANFETSIPEIWALLTEEERGLVQADARIVTYKKNETIYTEEEIPKDLMCIIKGKVKIYKNGVGGRSQIIRMVRPVQNFAYRAYFADESYVTNASAFELSVICLISMTLIEELVKRNSKLALYFIKELSTDLGIADERVVSLTQKHIRGRLAESLVFLLENYGLEEDGATISIYLSREDLANLSNMTTSNAIRTLSIFVDERIISLDGRKIKIIDEEQLRKISKIG